MATKDQSLADLRRQIDEIDAAIQDLLIKRTDLIDEISQAKNGVGPAMRPGREAQVVRQLVARHRGRFPKPVIARIWREIISVFNGLQSDFAVAAYAPKDDPLLADLARDHFGSLTPITAYGTIHGVLRAVSAGKATVGVLPMPSDSEKNPWWPSLARGEGSQPRIVACLPFAAMRPGGPGRTEGLVIGQNLQEASGEDRSFIILETAEGVSRSALQRLLGLIGFEDGQIRSTAESHEGRLQLIEVAGFVTDGDPRLEQLLAGSPGRIQHAWAAGSYAIPVGDIDTAAVRQQTEEATS